jgi:hypothetical protein
LAQRLSALQDVLGAYQDAIVTATLLRDYGIHAHLAGQNAFTFGLLHARQHAAGERILCRTIVRALRRTRPLRLIVDLSDLHDLDAINLGTLAAACHLGDDHRVAVFIDNSHPSIADRLTAAGVPRHRLRNIAPAA